MNQFIRQSRRLFLRSSAGAAIGGVMFAQQQTGSGGSRSTSPSIPAAPAGSFLNAEDNAILRFALAMEIVAADIWSQIADGMAGDTTLTSQSGNIDALLPQIISDINRDEQSHANFLAAYAASA